jgi:Asp/Glu/hydantoin racemase
MTKALDVPVFTSALLQIPFVQNIIGSENYVGVITANKASLTKEHFDACGITDDMNIDVVGLEDSKEWCKIFNSPNEKFDMEIVIEEVLEVATKCVRNNPKVKALVLECTDLPPFAKQINKAVNLPVFDYISMVDYIAVVLGDY